MQSFTVGFLFRTLHFSYFSSQSTYSDTFDYLCNLHACQYTYVCIHLEIYYAYMLYDASLDPIIKFYLLNYNLKSKNLRILDNLNFSLKIILKINFLFLLMYVIFFIFHIQIFNFSNYFRNYSKKKVLQCMIKIMRCIIYVCITYVDIVTFYIS